MKGKKCSTVLGLVAICFLMVVLVLFTGFTKDIIFDESTEYYVTFPHGPTAAQHLESVLEQCDGIAGAEVEARDGMVQINVIGAKEETIEWIKEHASYMFPDWEIVVVCK